MSKARFRAIVVDDDPIVQKTVTFALQQQGFQCDQAAAGNHALKQLAEHTYDVVVTDLRMPNGHGHALATEILKCQVRPLIVVHSSIENPQIMEDLIALGVDDIVEKPTNYEMFAAKLSAMVARRFASAETQVQPNHSSQQNSDTRDECNDKPQHSTDGPSSIAEAITDTNERGIAGSAGSNTSRGRSEAEAGSRWIKEPNRRILVIDDDPTIHNDFRKILCGEDRLAERANGEAGSLDDLLKPSFQLKFDIDFTFDGEEGIARVRDALRDDSPFALAFVAEKGGFETITQLWQEDPHLEIVITNRSSACSWSDVADQFGVRDQLMILRKPLDYAEVAQLAASQTEKWNLSRRAEIHWARMELLITERTREIQRSHREIESLLAAISSLLIGVDADGVVTRWNATAEEVFGIAAREAVGRLFRDLDVEWVDENVADQLFEQFHADEMTRTTVKLVRDKSVCVLGISIYPVLDEGIQRGCLCLGTDITKQCQLAQQLQQAQKLEAVGQLAAGVAHEINTPMQYIGDNLEFLQNKMGKLEPLLKTVVKFLAGAEEQGEENKLVNEMTAALKKMKVKSFLPQVTEAIGDSRDGVQHVSRIVRAMKEFAHPGQEEKVSFDINRAVESAIAVSTNEWKYVAEVDMNLDDSIPLVPALAGELNQVFLNILVNAAHAIGDTNNDGAAGKGTITVSSTSAGDYVEVTIADTGTGIPDEVKQRIFDPFFTTKEVGKGTGQGLAIAHSVVVQKHGGRLSCDSSPGEGTTFSIQLPVELSVNQPDDKPEPAMICE